MVTHSHQLSCSFQFKFNTNSYAYFISLIFLVGVRNLNQWPENTFMNDTDANSGSSWTVQIGFSYARKKTPVAFHVAITFSFFDTIDPFRPPVTSK